MSSTAPRSSAASTPPKPARPDTAQQIVRLIGPGCLAGVRCSDWWRLLAANDFYVSPRFWGKAAHLTVSSLVTSPLSWLEGYLYRPVLDSTAVEPPLFVLGSWRSGTTFLHNLLSQDERFAAPDLYQTMYPRTFRLSRWWWEPMLRMGLPRKRFMDNVEQSFSEPAEDEMAIGILSRRSNMLAWTFPRNEARYERYLTFEGTTDREQAEFKNALKYFVRKVQQRAGRPLILKSPNHTARIRLLLETFPEAKFLHIRRHPYNVFRSFRHMARQVIPVWGLQKYDDDAIDEMIVRLYRKLNEAYFAQRDLIPAGRLHEIAYEDLAAAPRAKIEEIYEALNLPDFRQMKPALDAYLGEVGEYRKNRHADIPAETREILHREWGFCFDRWDYERDLTGIESSDASAPAE